MTEWKEYKLGEIAKFSQGLQVPVEMQSSTCSDRQVRFIRIVDITQNLPANIRYINTPDEKYIIRKGDVVMLRYGYPGVVADNFEGVIANNLFKISPTRKDIYINKYLYYFLKQKVVLDYFDSTQNSTTMPAITFAQVSDLDILLPSIEAQKVIVSILTSFDDKIGLLNRENATLEAMAETLFRQWFVVEAKEDDVALGDVVKTTSGGTPSRKHAEYYENGTICWVKSKELEGSFISSTEELITKDAVSNSSAKMLPEKSVLIAMYGATVGEYGILSKPMTCNQAVCALIPNEKYPFTYLFVWAAMMKQEFINLATGAAQQNISQDLIKQQYVSGDVEKIKEYDSRVRSLFDKMENNQKQIQTLIQTRDGLLPRLMGGEIRV